jgi:hypothetical protein
MVTEPPKVFISYSWASQEYGERVVALAEQLTADGVHVLFDRWDLREGQDKHVFMEKAVTDPTVRRVLVLCDPTYAAKADGRQGGVGTETLIISPEVYREASQEKFVPVIMESDEAGRVVVPKYLDGRIYIDLSDDTHRSPEYEKLIRNIFGKPELSRPQVGRPPAYVEEGRIVLRTGRSLEAFRDAVIRDRPHQMGLLDDFLGRLADAYERQVIQVPGALEDLDLALSKSIDDFAPYKEEFLGLLQFITKSDDCVRFFEQLHEFFEWLANRRRSQKPVKWEEGTETENLTFLGWELFLYAVAAALRSARFEAVPVLLEPFLLTSWKGEGPKLRSYAAMEGSYRILQDVTQKRLGTRWVSYAANLLQTRATDRDWPFEALMEADFVLWFRAAANDRESAWYPHTAAYAEMMPVLPLFTRAHSARFFGRVSVALGVTDRNDLLQKFETIPDRLFFEVGHFWGGRGAYAELFQLDKVGTR